MDTAIMKLHEGNGLPTKVQAIVNSEKEGE